MSDLLTVMECADEANYTDHTINTVTGIATCEECAAETPLTPVELAGLLA